MIKRIKCKTCGGERDMLESGDHFICTSCGTIYDLEYIANSFYTPLLIEISFLIRDLDQLSGTPIDRSDDGEEEPEFEISDRDELNSEDAELTDADKAFLMAKEISLAGKAKFCLDGYVYRNAVEQDPDRASAFIDAVLNYNKNNIAACLIKAWENTWSIPKYTMSRTGDAPWESLDSLPVSFEGETNVKFSQELFTQVRSKELADHLQSILNLLLSSIRNALSEQLCLKTYHIASTLLDLYEVFLELNTLDNLKECPIVEKYGEYLEYELAMEECKNRLQSTAAARLTELDVSDVALDAEHPHFYDAFPDIPNWACHLAEVEYRTAEEIWEKTVVSNVDLQTGQVSAPHQLQVHEGIWVIDLLLGRYTNVDAEKIADTGLHELQIAQKMVKKLLNVIHAVESFSFSTLKDEDVVSSFGNAEELEKKLSHIDGELSKRL